MKLPIRLYQVAGRAGAIQPLGDRFTHVTTPSLGLRSVLGRRWWRLTGGGANAVFSDPPAGRWQRGDLLPSESVTFPIDTVHLHHPSPALDLATDQIVLSYEQLRCGEDLWCGKLLSNAVAAVHEP